MEEKYFLRFLSQFGSFALTFLEFELRFPNVANYWVSSLVFSLNCTEIVNRHRSWLSLSFLFHPILVAVESEFPFDESNCPSYYFGLKLQLFVQELLRNTLPYLSFFISFLSAVSFASDVRSNMSEFGFGKWSFDNEIL